MSTWRTGFARTVWHYEGWDFVVIGGKTVARWSW
nr:MAG TPA: hypothetical protein [Caudoviricetes sp.]